MSDQIQLKTNTLRKFSDQVGELIEQQPNNAQNYIDVAWTLMGLAATQIAVLRKSGAAVSEEAFMQMARDSYRNVFAGKGS